MAVVVPNALMEVLFRLTRVLEPANTTTTTKKQKIMRERKTPKDIFEVMKQIQKERKRYLHAY